MTRRLITFGVVLAIWAPVHLKAGMFHVQTNVTARLALPLTAGERSTVFVKGAGSKHPWRELEALEEDGRLLLELDPGIHGGSDLLLLVDPPEGVDINDTSPPALTAMSIDGKSVQPVPAWQGEPTCSAPTEISWSVSDAANALCRDSVKVSLDGEPILGKYADVTWDGDRSAVIRFRRGDLEYGRYLLSASVADVAPDANSIEVSAGFEWFDATNVLRGEPGVAEVKVDSHFPSYPSVAPVTDGLRHLPGSGAGNDVTWASAENDEPHWVDVTLKKPAAIKEVTVYFARESGISRHLSVLVPEEGGGFKEVYHSPEGGLKPSIGVTLRFDAVTTDRFRILQPANGGSATRPGLMWLNEIEAR